MDRLSLPGFYSLGRSLPRSARSKPFFNQGGEVTSGFSGKSDLHDHLSMSDRDILSLSQQPHPVKTAALREPAHDDSQNAGKGKHSKKLKLPITAPLKLNIKKNMVGSPRPENSRFDIDDVEGNSLVVTKRSNIGRFMTFFRSPKSRSYVSRENQKLVNHAAVIPTYCEFGESPSPRTSPKKSFFPSSKNFSFNIDEGTNRMNSLQLKGGKSGKTREGAGFGSRKSSDATMPYKLNFVKEGLEEVRKADKIDRMALLSGFPVQKLNDQSEVDLNEQSDLSIITRRRSSDLLSEISRRHRRSRGRQGLAISWNRNNQNDDPLFERVPGGPLPPLMNSWKRESAAERARSQLSSSSSGLDASAATLDSVMPLPDELSKMVAQARAIKSLNAKIYQDHLNFEARHRASSVESNF